MVRTLLPFVAITVLNVSLIVFLTIVLAFGFSAETIASSSDTVNKTLVWPDGTRYVGEVRDGKRWGKGTIFWNDGTRFVGTFANDLRNGPGTMILPDGSVYNGYFENDALVDTPVTAAIIEKTEEHKPALTETVSSKSALAKTVDIPAENISKVVSNQTNTPKEVLAETKAIPLNLNVDELTEEARTNIESMIDLWAAAWSDKNVVQYLAYYSDEFKVPGQQSRRQWEGLRRSRLQRPKSIKVTIDYEKVEITATNSAVVVFNQRYESDIFSDRTRKEFRLKKEGESWFIISERSL
ncbi:MAG: hypothetical protein JKY88_16860 [Pseudomonadales bacterium]|nr:hypothetical protein [Pseudomonadales bacterium]